MGAVGRECHRNEHPLDGSKPSSNGGHARRGPVAPSGMATRQASDATVEGFRGP